MPLRRLRADAGQPAELVDQRLDGRLVDLHVPGATSAEQPTEGTEVEAAGHPAHRLGLALLRAAERVGHRGDDEVLEHLDVVGVDDLGRDRHGAQVARCRVTVAFTTPPPAEPSMVSSASAACAVAMSCCMRCIWRMRLACGFDGGFCFATPAPTGAGCRRRR